MFAVTPHIVAISEAGRREIAALYGVAPQRLAVVYNGVDLERFHLEQPAPPSEPPADDDNDDGSEGLVFRALGYLNYAAAGSFWGSEEYRASRTNGSWEPTLENSMARIGAIGASTEALNWSSSKLYREGMRGQAWALRVGQLATFGVAAGWNFNKGWKRE